MGLTVDRSVESLDPSGVAVQATWIAFGIGVLLTCAGVFAYNTIPVVRTGATPGKQLLKIKIVRGDGSPVSWSTAAARATLPIVTGIVGLAPLLWPAVFVVPLVSLVLLFVDGRRRSLEDRVAGTIVVKAQS